MFPCFFSMIMIVKQDHSTTNKKEDYKMLMRNWLPKRNSIFTKMNTNNTTSFPKPFYASMKWNKPFKYVNKEDTLRAVASFQTFNPL